MHGLFFKCFYNIFPVTITSSIIVYMKIMFVFKYIKFTFTNSIAVTNVTTVATF